MAINSMKMGRNIRSTLVAYILKPNEISASSKKRSERKISTLDKAPIQEAYLGNIVKAVKVFSCKSSLIVLLDNNT